MKIKISYDRISRFYDGFFFGVDWFVSKQRKEVLRQAKGVILEVGVGSGSSFKDYPLGKQIIAVDASREMLRLADKKNMVYGGNIELYQADAQNLPFKDETFDTIFTSMVFCTVRNPIRGLRELHRVLKKGGQLLMIEHVKSGNKVVGYMMDKINPLIKRFDNINRETENNLELAGFNVRLEKDLFFDVVKYLVASG
jgi:ubiquinone/menaquinone biosynthesis C-methylase UbiE